MKRNASLLRMAVVLLAIAALVSVCFSGCTGDGEGGTNGGDDLIPEVSDKAIDYTVTVKTEGGLALDGLTVSFLSNGNVVARLKTNDKGSVSLRLDPAEYSLEVSGLKAGYNAPEQMPVASANGGETLVSIKTRVINEAPPSGHKTYQIADVLYDFSFHAYDGSDVKLSDILKTKKLVVLNFWATWCPPCRAEFPAIEEALSGYKDSVEIIAFSISDTYEACRSFRDENGYTFEMTANNGIYDKFSPYGNGGIPFTIFIDRYGMFVNYIDGSDPSVESWITEFAGYCSDAYVPHPGQPISADEGGDEPEKEPEKPNVTMPASEVIEAVLNGNGMSAKYTGPVVDTVWPWVLSEDGTSVVPSNIGKHSTVAMLNTSIDLAPGRILTFDYRASIEHDNNSVYEYDTLAVYINGYRAVSVSGTHSQWEPLYIYTPAYAGRCDVTIIYTKDESDAYLPGGREFVEIKNMRTISEEELRGAGGTLIAYRPAAYGINNAENKKTSYLNYADVVYNPDDGYYHVGNKDGALLLCSLASGTAWSPTTVNDLAYGGYLKFGLVDYSEIITEYTWQEVQSSLGYCPVDNKLADMLYLIVSNIGEGPDHDKEWLELCCYFDHYGVGKGVTEVRDVRQGISIDSAYTAKEGKNHVLFRQVLVPRGLIYEFVPERSGAYAFYSINNGEGEDGMIDTEAWLLLDNGTLRGREVDSSDGIRDDDNFRLYRYCKAGEKYYIAVGFKDPSTLSGFDFIIEYLGESYSEFLECTRHYTTDLEGTQILIDRQYGVEAELGEDGYYHKVITAENGEKTLDLSDHGYLYVEFTGVSIFMSFFMDQNAKYYTLEEYIKIGGFNFIGKTDAYGNSLSELGDHQQVMEQYLAMALAAEGTEHGFVRADRTLVEILENTLVRLYGFGMNVEDEWLMFCHFYREHNAVQTYTY